jgi:succinyl-diaminopimelate desuccinylase
MDIKEQIHGLTEEMLTNLGRLVAIDSQLGTPAEDKPFGEGPAKALEEGLKIAQEHNTGNKYLQSFPSADR